MKVLVNARRLPAYGWKNEAIYAVLPLLFYLANLYRMTGHSGFLYRASIYTAGAVGLFKFISAKKQNAAVALTMYVYFVTSVLNYLVIRNVTITDIVADVLLFGITYILLRYPLSYNLGVLLYYVTFVTFLWYYRNGVSTHYVLTSSGNYISVLLIISASLYYIALHNSGRKMRIWDLLPAFLSFFLSIWARGRGGISASFAMAVLIGLIFINGLERRRIRRILLITSAAIAALVIISYSNFSVINWFFSLGKWGYKGIENAARTVIWGSYFDKMKESLLYVIFGAPLRDIPIIAGYGGNCHNSFLQLHAYNGILMIILFTILLILAGWYYIRRKQWLMLSVLVAFSIRAFTDKFVFGQYGMPVMMYLVLNPYIIRQKRQTNIEV